jgi:hypothetical protein
MKAIVPDRGTRTLEIGRRRERAESSRHRRADERSRRMHSHGTPGGRPRSPGPGDGRLLAVERMRPHCELARTKGGVRRQPRRTSAPLNTGRRTRGDGKGQGDRRGRPRSRSGASRPRRRSMGAPSRFRRRTSPAGRCRPARGGAFAPAWPPERRRVLSSSADTSPVSHASRPDCGHRHTCCDRRAASRYTII